MGDVAAAITGKADGLRVMFVTSSLCRMLRLRGYRQVSGPYVRMLPTEPGEWRGEWRWPGGDLQTGTLLAALDAFVAARHTRQSIVLGAVTDPTWGNRRSWEVMPDVGRDAWTPSAGSVTAATAGRPEGAAERKEGVDIEVRFSPEGINVSVVRDLAKAMRERGLRHVVLVSNVSKATIHPRASEAAVKLTKKLTEETGHEHRIELFDESFFRVMLAEHVDVPPHEVLSPAEAAELLANLRRPAEALPIISKDDRMARLLDIRPRQIVRVLYPSPTTGRFPVYHRCK
jgi:DNA-directed RNA polymerase subunit H (RpoH/RPB5)